MATSLKLTTEMELKLLSTFLTNLITYCLTYFIQAPAQTILSKFAGLKYHKCLSSSSLYYTLLSYPILCYIILYYIILHLG